MLTCGGTGGHINPAIAVAEKLNNLFSQAEFLFVGGEGNMELELVPRAGYNIEAISAASLRRGIKPSDLIHNLQAVFKVSNALRQSGKILKRFRPDIVIGTGGYVCYPVLRAAKNMKIPTMIHESNVLPSLTARMLEKHVDKILLGFEESVQYYKFPEKLKVTGTPVREGFRIWDKREARIQLGYMDLPLVLSVWGSSGAMYMNEITLELICKNEESPVFRHIYSTGSSDYYDKIVDELNERGNSELKYTELRSYIYDMPKVMAASDLVICRAGAVTLNELSATGKPAILIPSAYVANNHQEKNAQVIANRGAAVMIKENDCTAELLYKTICELITNEDKLGEMSAEMKKLDSVKASDKVVETILEFFDELKRDNR